MTEQTPDMAELVTKRRVAGCQLLLSYLMRPDSEREMDAYAMNLRVDLSDVERGELAWLLLRSMTPDMAHRFVQAAFEGAGWPTVGLMDDPMADAKFWASGANAKELQAWAVASFNQMDDRSRGHFLTWAKRQAGQSDA